MTRKTKHFRRGGVLAGSAVLAFGVAAALPAGAGTPARIDLPNPIPDTTTGTSVKPLDPGQQVPLRVYLAGRPGVQAAALAVSDPASPRYGRYLTPAQFANRFGPTIEQTGRVRDWLTQQGMAVTGTTAHYVAVNATVAQINSAFDTQVSEYDTTETVKGGGTVTHRLPGLVGRFSGKNATIAVLINGHVPTLLADSNRFFAGHGLPEFRPGQYVEDIPPSVEPTCAATNESNGDPLETAIDIQSAHMAAPDAKIVQVAADCSTNPNALLETWLDASARVVDRHLADIVTNSFGGTDTLYARGDEVAWDLVFQQAALEGIGFLYSTGDNGAFGEVHNAQFPANPWVTAVGGTSIEIEKNGNRANEYVWGDNSARITEDGSGYEQPPPGGHSGGSGGGISRVFPQPAYQKPVVPHAMATSEGTTAPARVVPDISANAGNAWLIGVSGALDADDPSYAEFGGGAGTSASTPLMAGILADAIQAAGKPLGFVNPRLYRLKDTPAIKDILPVNPASPPILRGERSMDTIDPNVLTTLGEDWTLTAEIGYDNATGLGVPTASFIPMLAGHRRPVSTSDTQQAGKYKLR
ncbi:protease pro-enzyme activation domain-containing protein [Actinocrispum sp. NPDC049592]|uniref:S53 family peptidase n=1 Tax=Actinocrispum sp. NPDC049592 TaxID=3154835 RepID=UPI00342D6720